MHSGQPRSRGDQDNQDQDNQHALRDAYGKTKIYVTREWQRIFSSPLRAARHIHEPAATATATFLAMILWYVRVDLQTKTHRFPDALDF